MNDNLPARESEIILYESADGVARVEVLVEGETFWPSQRRMAEILGPMNQAISYHLQNVYDFGELSHETTVKEILTVQEGAR